VERTLRCTVASLVAADGSDSAADGCGACRLGIQPPLARGASMCASGAPPSLSGPCQ
jgi:hypothetical protein